MYNINEVTQVNTSYIFFVFADGSQDRKVVDMSELKYLYDDVCQNMKHYDFMKTECENVRESTKTEQQKLEKIMIDYEKFIESNQEDPSVRRGIHNVCYSLESTTKKYRELSYEIVGINRTWNHATDTYWKLYKLQKQIESVLRSR